MPGKDKIRLSVCLPGANEHREYIWKNAIVPMGLEDHVDFYEQINTPFGRNRDNIDNFPEDWIGRDLEPIREAIAERSDMVYRTRWRIREPRGGFLNYEPRRYVEMKSGHHRITERWMLNILRNGMMPHDVEFCQQMMEGAREGLPSGFPLSMYFIPRVRKRELNDDDRRNLKLAEPVFADFDHLQMNFYPVGQMIYDDLQPQEAKMRQALRVSSYVDELRPYQIPLMGLFWLSFRLRRGDSFYYNSRTINMAVRSGITDICLWIQATSRGVAQAGVDRLLDLESSLKHYDIQKAMMK